MKQIIQLILFIVLAIIGYGLYLQYFTESENYQKYVGSGVLLMVFVLMPLFLYHRYKDKNIEDYRFKGFNNDTNKDKA
jgi:membrane protein YdbS with pleckstrin-like domain